MGSTIIVNGVSGRLLLLGFPPVVHVHKELGRRVGELVAQDLQHLLDQLLVVRCAETVELLQQAIQGGLPLKLHRLLLFPNVDILCFHDGGGYSVTHTQRDCCSWYSASAAAAAVATEKAQQK